MERKKPLFIAFSTQKGGAGKSVFTTLAASYLHYKCGLNILVVDCDKGQYSLQRMRNRDQRIVESDPIHIKQFYAQMESIQKRAYTILCSAPDSALNIAEQHIANSNEEFDIVFFDLVGTVQQDGVMTCVAGLDYIFAPIVSDHLALESSLAFALTAKNLLLDNPSQKLKGIYLFWNKVVAAERTTLYDDYSAAIKDMGIPILNTYIPETVRYKKELRRGQKNVFRSTLFPISPRMLKGSRFDELIYEILQILKIDIHDAE